MSRIIDLDRRCKWCGARLSSYNDDTLCYPCQEREDKAITVNTRRFGVPPDHIPKEPKLQPIID